MTENSIPFESIGAEIAPILAPAFAELLSSHAGDFALGERECLATGHRVLARALGLALEMLDARLRVALPEGVRAHDRRERSLATTLGDVRFRYTRCRDDCGNSVVPLADELDFPWGARISPAAREFLVTAGADVSYQRAANLMGAAGGSSVSAASVMRCVHRAGELCAAEDEAMASALVDDGVLPDAECECAEICVESDGTYFKLQGFEEGDSVEVRSMVAYAGKAEDGGKTLRVKAVRHGCVAGAKPFWDQSTAVVGTRFDLSKVELAHMGSDGEACYLGGFLRCGCDEAHSVDPC